MRLHRILLVLALTVPSAAAAQTSTVEGVQAIVRGDYASAARILRPLAEAAREPDPLAQFFLATLYETGEGVARNHIRACGLYLKAAAVSNPVAGQSAALAAAIYEQSPTTRDLCVAASMGTWFEPVPAAFTLGPDHWVKTDHTGFTVGYRGTQKRAAMGWGGVDWIFLPTRYTRLAVTRPVAMERHFVEFFVWMPVEGSTPTAWALTWFVHEVVGVDVLPVAGDGFVLSAVAPLPPSASSAEQFGVIRANADGDAERIVLGVNPRTVVIPFNAGR
jgi:hypothetical protein